MHQGGQMNREANDYTQWREAFRQESMLDQGLPLAKHGVWNDWTKATAKAGNYR
jgi:hypothetical protein